MQQPSLFTTGRVLKDATISRHKGNPASMDANKRTNKTRDAQRILAFIRAKGKSWSKEIVRETGIPLQTVSARCSELKAAGFVIGIGERIEGCEIIICTDK